MGVQGSQEVPMPAMGTSLSKTTKRHGKHMKSLLPGTNNAVKKALAKAEMEKGGPVFTADVLICLREITTWWTMIPCNLAMQDLWRQDEILTDKYSDRWSLVPQEGFQTFSDRFESLFEKDYTLDKNLKLMPKENMTVNFDWLKSLLLSKDLSRLPELKAMSANPKFLDRKVNLDGNRICFASYPRTGNTFLRTFIEQCTGVYTGSDMPTEITCSMQMSGITSEQHYGEDSIWVTKTHHPMSKDENKHYEDKIIYITRNPIEVFPSFAGLFSTGSHSVVPVRPWNTYTEFWDFWIEKQSGWMAYFDRKLREQSKKTPTFFIRYEDLKLRPYELLEKMFAFMLDVESIEGTVIEAQLKDVTKSDHTAKARYTLKSNSANLSRNRPLYDDKKMEMIQKNLKEHNYFFGYANMGGDENQTQFFDYAEHSKEDSDMFMGYLKANDQITKERERWAVNYGESAIHYSDFASLMAHIPKDLRVKMPSK